MTGELVKIIRYPIKSHGREELASVTLEAGQTIPWDRHWAVAHEESQADGSEWAPCQNFSRGSKAPMLSAISATLDEETATITLRHPDRDDLTFRPDDDPDALIKWAGGMIPENRAQSARVIKGPRGFTDSDFPSVTLCNVASHRAVEQKIGRNLSIHRWRGNFWFEGAAPWEEFEWIDREVQIGEAVVIGRERTDRCLATHSNPDTGSRDADILGTLDSWGHRDFSIRAEIIRGGMIRPGDSVTPL